MQHMEIPPVPAAPIPRVEIIARGLLVREGHALLCKNLRHGYFYLPGGHVEPGERAAEALAREFLEETGCPARIGGFLLASEQLFTQKGKPRHEINLVFHVEHLSTPTAALPGPGAGLPAVPSLEAEIGFEWVELAAVADLDVRPESARAWLATGCRVDGPPWVSEGTP